MAVYHSYSTECNCDVTRTESAIENAWNVLYQTYEKVQMTTNLNLGGATLPECSDSWVWSPQFLEMIAQAEDDIARGKIKSYQSAQDLLDGLNAE